jgi:hypothetical protein
MKLVGHWTRRIYSRYAIVAESDLKEAGDKLASLLDGRKGMPHLGHSAPRPADASGKNP